MIGKLYKSKGEYESKDWQHIIAYPTVHDGRELWQSIDLNCHNTSWVEPVEWWEEYYEEISIKDSYLSIEEYLCWVISDCSLSPFIINGFKDSTIMKNIENYYKEI